MSLLHMQNYIRTVLLEGQTASGDVEFNVPLGTKAARITLEVTALQAESGTPLLDVTIQDAVNDIKYFTVGTFTQKNAADAVGQPSQVVNICPENVAAGFSPYFGHKLRAHCVLSGGATNPEYGIRLTVFPIS